MVRIVFLKLWSTPVCWVVCGDPQAVSEKKKITKIVFDTEQMKNTHMRICAKTSFVGRPSTERR
jgi:hypothetical protein